MYGRSYGEVLSSFFSLTTFRDFAFPEFCQSIILVVTKGHEVFQQFKRIGVITKCMS